MANRKRRSLPPEAAPSSKKQKNDISLPPEIFSLVLSFLAPRQMLRLACTSPTIMGYVTHELVVRNTVVLGGSHAANNIRYILDHGVLLCWPSPMRLLRIVNGRRCEFCPRKTNSVRLRGLFLCACCANDMTAEVKRRRQQCADATDVKGLPTSSSTPYLMSDVAVAQEQSTDLMEAKITKALGQHCCAPLTSYHDTIRRLNMVYDEADMVKYVLWKEICDRREVKERARANKIIHAISQVKSLILEQHRYAMEYTLTTAGTHCSLAFGVTHELMKELLNAPSKITRKKLKHVAAAIDEAYPVVLKHGLHDFSCLSTSDPLQAAIKTHLEKTFSAGADFLRDMSMTGALKRIRCDHDVVSPVLKRGFHWTYGDVPTGLRNIIATLIVGDDDDVHGLSLAKSICAGINKETLSATSSEWSLCQRLYKLGIEEYAVLKPAVAAYLEDMGTQAFVQGCCDNESGQNADQLWLRAKQSVVTKISYSPADYDKVKSWLRGKKWMALREYHSSKVWTEYKSLSWEF